MGNPQASILRQVIEGHPQLTTGEEPGEGGAFAPKEKAGARAMPVHAGHMKLLFDNAPVAMAMFDTQMRYLLANRRWLEDFKLTQMEIAGRSQYELFPSLHPGWRHVYDRALGGQVVRSDRDAITQDGRPVVYRWEVRPWRHIDTSIGGVMITCEHLYAPPAGRQPPAESRADLLDDPGALWESRLPLMALDAEGRILRVSHGVPGLLLAEDGSVNWFWEAFGERIRNGPLQQHVLATLRSVLSGGKAQALISVHGEGFEPLEQENATPTRWVVARTSGEALGVPGGAVLAIGLADGAFPKLLGGVVPPPASVLFGDGGSPMPPPPPVPPAPAVDEAFHRRITDEISHIRQLLKDATDVESQSRQREARLRAVLELAPCGLLVLDEWAQPLYFNAHMHQLLGRPLAEGRPVEEWLTEGSRDEEHREQIVHQWREGVWRKQLTLVISLATADGLLKDVEIRPVSLPGGGLLVMMQDVTEARRSEEMLRSTEAKFRTLVHENPLPVLLADRSGAVFDVNPAAEALLGYNRAELRRMRLDRWLLSDSVTKRAATLRDMLDRGDRSAWMSAKVIHRDGAVHPVDLRIAIVPDAVGQPLFTVHFFRIPEEEEKTAGRQPAPFPVSHFVQEAPSMFQTPVAAPSMPALRPVVLLTTDVNGKIRTWSAEAEAEFGFETGEILERGLHTLFRPSDATGFYSELSASRSSESSRPVRWTYYHKQKGRTEGEFKVRPLGETGLSVCLIKEVAAFAESRTALPVAAAAGPLKTTVPDARIRIPASALGSRPPARPVEADLKRERLLVGEAHHRVKNDLQIISSMLNLQITTLRNEEAREALRSSQNRVKSIAALHQHLYLLATGEGDGFQSFASGLISHLRECYDAPEYLVRLRLDLPDRPVPEEWLMPLALALNEMVSNAFKHAFPNGREGSMRVELAWDNQRGSLTVQDNGKGMPADFNDYQGNGLGMKILRVFAGQLGGEVKIDSQPGQGSTFRLDFPVGERRPA